MWDKSGYRVPLRQTAWLRHRVVNLPKCGDGSLLLFQRQLPGTGQIALGEIGGHVLRQTDKALAIW